MDIRSADFVENIEFSDSVTTKTEMKEEDQFKKENHEDWKSPLFDFKPKLEQIEASETGLVEIKTESEEFFSNDQTETLHTESLEIKDEFMWTMKDFVSNNDSPKYIEQHIAPVHEKKNPFECSLCPYKTGRKGDFNKHVANVHEKKKPFECSLCPYKTGRKCDFNRHVANVHKKKKPFVCSRCPSKFLQMSHFIKHIAAVHEHFKCTLCPYNFESNDFLNKHIAAVHEKKQTKPLECSLCPYKGCRKGDLKKHVAAVHENKKPFVCSMCPSTFLQRSHFIKYIAAVHTESLLNARF